MYLDINALFWILGLVSLAILWYKNLAYRDLAYKAALQFCKEADVQLLDQTVYMRSLRPVKHSQWYLRRHYQFEFTSTGSDRYKGSITLLGKRVIDIQLAAHRMH